MTDIVGSTEQWEADSAAMQKALERHNQLLKHQVTYEGGGNPFNFTGDGFCVSFDAARNAVLSAVKAQRLLQENDFRVRMALHVGHLYVIKDGYCGPTLNRVARIIERVNGGAIVASEAILDELGKKIKSPQLTDEGVEFQRLGYVNLRDVPDAMCLYAINAHGLRASSLRS